VPGASLVRFVTLAALIVSVALALWLLDVHRAWIAVGVVVAWLAATLIEWTAWSRFGAPRQHGEPPRGSHPGHRGTAPPPTPPAAQVATSPATAPDAAPQQRLQSPVVAAPPADEAKVRSFRLFGFRVTLRAKPKRARTVRFGPAESEVASDPVPPAPPEPERKPLTLGDQRSDGPRRWSLWALERAARDRPVASAEAEEQSFLLLHLRRFAAPDGLLPVELDALVRHSFPSLVGDLEEA